MTIGSPIMPTVFGAFGSTLAWLDQTFAASGTDQRGGSGGAGYWHEFLAGCWAGFLQSLALAPFEHIKVGLKKHWRLV